jgi:hypothetical protein
MFRQLQSLWHSFNPSNSDTISKEVYARVCQVLGREFNIDTSNANLGRDLTLDFKHNTGLVFAEYYDSIFELLDNLAANQNLIEYLSLAKLAKIAVKNSEWYSTVRPTVMRNFISRR